jgi:BirA family biotin operon repressor/biotin-[acetyl-CoA-carboxylase] ligase
MVLTPAQRALLGLLADGEFHSGAELGQALGVSRAAIWKTLGKLEELELPLERTRQHGYRIAGGVDLHDAAAIRVALGDAARSLLRDITVVDVIDSTNEQAKRAADPLNGGGICYLAERQTGGRGRMGRRWVSPFARNLYLTVAWEFDGGIAVVEGLSLAVGVAARRALAAIGVTDIGLKWPNDLLRSGRKLGGILIEVIGDPQGVCRVITGIGINVAMPAVAAREIDQPWRDLSDCRVSRDRLAAALLEQLLPLLHGFPERGFRAYREEWEAAHVHQGRPVRISTGSRVIDGLARGVNEQGALALECSDGLRFFSGGEVSVREGP